MFEKVFGADKESINKNCIILPANDINLFQSLNIKEVSKGMFYDVSHADNCSVILLKHRSFAGDCVLMLEETRCENIFLFGSCGALKGDIGDKIIVEKSLNLESFSVFLKTYNFKNFDFCLPDKELVEKFVAFTQGRDYKKCVCATVSSLVLEEKKAGILCDGGIGCADMESSMVFSAAAKIGRKAMALFYVTDVVGKLNFYDRYDDASRKKIKGSKKSITGRLIKFLLNECA